MCSLTVPPKTQSNRYPVERWKIKRNMQQPFIVNATSIFLYSEIEAFPWWKILLVSSFVTADKSGGNDSIQRCRGNHNLNILLSYLQRKTRKLKLQACFPMDGKWSIHSSFICWIIPHSPIFLSPLMKRTPIFFSFLVLYMFYFHRSTLHFPTCFLFI